MAGAEASRAQPSDASDAPSTAPSADVECGAGLLPAAGLARAMSAATRSRCEDLFGELQVELGSLFAHNEALFTENRGLSAALQEYRDGASPFEKRVGEQGIGQAEGQMDALHYSPSDGVATTGSNGNLCASTQSPACLPVKLKGSRASEALPVIKQASNMSNVYSRSCSVSASESKADQEIYREFRRICQRGRRMVSAEDLAGMLAIQQGRQCSAEPVRASFKTNVDLMGKRLSASRRNEVADRYREALCALNQELMSMDGNDIDPEFSEYMQAQTYSLLFKDADMVTDFDLPEEVLTSLGEICQVVINHSLARDIAEITDVDQSMLHFQPTMSRSERIITSLDFVTGVMILLNMGSITVSLDYWTDWPGWDVVESCFMLFFISEIGIRCYVAGLAEHFCGPDAKWNLFDLIVVSLGIVDLCLQIDGSSANAPDVTLVRIVRLLRVVKMVRVLRLKTLKELRLIVNGLSSGLRVILWAFVFLYFFVLMLAVTAKQLLYSRGSLPWHHREMFSSVSRSMFTIYQCFVTDTCMTTEGTPLIPILVKQFGGGIIVVYVLCYAFLQFGLFNLIMATIVENTMQASKADEVKRMRQRQREYLSLAHTVQDLVKAMCTEQKDIETQSSFKQFGERWWKKKRCLQLRGMLSSRISPKQFIDMLERPDIQDLFDKLGVKLIDPTQYIDSLDANKDGVLSIAELVRGLLKLRGGVEKADVVATLMVARDMQKSLHVLEALLTQEGRQANMHCSLSKTQNCHASLENCAPRMASEEDCAVSPPPPRGHRSCGDSGDARSQWLCL